MGSLIPLLVCVSVAQTAPQQNSNITYIKPLEPTQPALKTAKTESRIENVTIPTDAEKEIRSSSQANYSQPIYNYSDRIYSIKNKPKSTTEKIIPSTEDIKETSSEKPEESTSDIVAVESITSDRTFDETERTTASDETITEKYEEDSTVTTEVYEETTRLPTPRLLPKLSYYGKSSSGSFSQNLIPIPGKRKFRSRCRCEKIWNCAKLQISVPRCPEEYFMCCA
ncbi:uncharacterized protein LOC111359947 isoform X2 [Spodoptera litura]|uniref:Uncharacterized protein LOC111359947 isoform X2 n=1 Tax=Spodoptera litura TaxID=69820 RepID=A0A9J7ENA0_SPOLT|nr:uncharacterized protein LOC111359947 isoform X2 [Spodoptera litura]